MSLLAVSDVVTGYGPTIVNRGVSLTLAEGEIVTILGPNGAGKSTLLKAIAGLIKPRAGSIAFDGAEVTGSAADVMARRGVVLVPEGRKIFVDMTVEENLRLGAYARRDEAAVEADFETMLAFFQILATKRRDRGGSLSGGQQQMLAIARALCGRPRVLLLDEPSEGIQPNIVQEIGRLIRQIVERTGMSVLLVEQNLDLALQTARRVLVMEKGRIVHEGGPDDLRDEAILRRHLAI